ncbi:acyl-CoA dehydrogenase family protein [Bradyrhizobium sp. 190]|uniref:acyl-CoA dehydrogenase family protein n=1 Tax=Bradyrhizobium sp. 190 TaxID=2782658 RepID=UPI001FF747FE|nr:acyl-CoA dehydrogenase family protein [Bradyrhizobium sp. 190]MCK1513154.1 acyl-CoA dehydrogenase family protein [Bradyrhizobium sp. 190]
MDFELPDDLRLMKEQIRRFVDREIIPIEREAYEGASLKPDVRAMLEVQTKKMGYWLITTPEEYGGLGMGLLARVVLWEELGRTIALPTRKTQIFGPEPSPILLQLNERQRTDYLMPVIAGEKDCCFALTEPDAGSDPSGIRTRAVRDGDDYIINGYKRFITNAHEADFAQVLATVDPSKGSKGITAFLVDMDTPGVSIVRTEHMMMDDAPCEISFDNARVPAWKRIGEEGEGFKLAQDWINAGRIRHGARAIGVIERCLELSATYAKQRKTFGKPLAERQAIQWPIVDSYLDLRQLRPLVYHAAWKYDRGEDVRTDAYMVKLLGDRMAFMAADRCIQVFGGLAFTTDFPIEKFWRDSRSMMITEGPEEVLKTTLARHVFAQYASN